VKLQPWFSALLLAGLFLAVFAGNGCSTTPPAEPVVPAIAAVPPAPGIQPSIPRIEHASFYRQRLVLDFRTDGKPLHATATVEPVSGGRFTPAAAQLPVRVLEPAAEAVPQEVEPGATTVEILGYRDWQALLDSSLETLTPTQAGIGAAIDILRKAELVLYRSASGERVSAPLIFKPADIRIQRSYTFDQLLQVMTQQLSDRYPPAARLLFETGDDSDYGYPFVYAEPGADLILFLQQHPAESVRPGPARLGTTLKIIARSVADHVRGLFNQPVSSITRLFTMVSAATTDLARPTPLIMLEGQPVAPLAPGEPMDLVQWEATLDGITGTTASSGRLTYRVDGARFFPRLIDLIGSARESVWLRVYIFDNDDYATEIATLLKRRSHEIDVKVLVDGLGTLGARLGSAPSHPPEHVPEASITRYLEQDSAVRVRTVANIWFTGDHTKTILIDGETAFLGGMNIGREYRYDWHDLMVEVEGPVVTDIGEHFRRAWAASGFLGDMQQLFHRQRLQPASAGAADYPLRLLRTRPGDSQILRAQIAATRHARHHIYLENPYLTSDAILFELVLARRRGVDVRVILPYRTDSGLITRSNALAANTLLRHGIRVYIYPGMSHLKAAVYDGWACLGSANLDRLSLRTNHEMNLATSHAPAVDDLLAQVFTVDMEKSLELQEPLPGNWLDYLAELLADSL
jgi:cardiolipin synthase